MYFKEQEEGINTLYLAHSGLQILTLSIYISNSYILFYFDSLLFALLPGHLILIFISTLVLYFMIIFSYKKSLSFKLFCQIYVSSLLCAHPHLFQFVSLISLVPTIGMKIAALNGIHII